jgi:hypothetical protein
MKSFQNNDLTITVITAIILAIVFFGFIYPSMCSSTEGFDESVEEVGIAGDELEEPKEVIDEENKLIVAGPGYQAPGWDEPKEPLGKIPENYYFLDDGADGRMSIQHNLYSPSCCSSQYPTPFKTKHNPYVCKNKDKFVGSPYYGQTSFNDSGCLCATKEQIEFLYNRGGNGREWF